MRAHTGLRGICALYIVVFHTMVKIANLEGGSLMPLFFLLSGFTLAVVYGSCPVQPMTLRDFLCSGYSSRTDSKIFIRGVVNSHQEPSEDEYEPSNRKSFYWNRVSRILPTYYLCALLEIPLILAGYHQEHRPSGLLPSLIVTMIPVQPWFGTLFGYALNPPAWFICTLLSYYFMFPYWLSHSQRQSDDQLVRRMVKCYWLQLALIVGLNCFLAFTTW